MVVRPLPIAASVIATSGAASKRKIIETIRLTTPETRTAVLIFFTTNTATAIVTVTIARSNAKKMVTLIYSSFLLFLSSARTSDTVFSESLIPTKCAALASVCDETGLVIMTNIIRINTLPNQDGTIIPSPSKVNIVPSVLALVPVCMRLNESGMRTIPREPRKIKIAPRRVIKLPIISITFSILKPFLYVASNNKHAGKT